MLYEVITQKVAESETSPFAAVTPFEADINVPLEPGSDWDEIIAQIDQQIPTDNLFYAIRLTGIFKSVKTRSVPRQTPPYPPLVEVVKTQPVFTWQDVAGTVVGFRCPAFVKGINVPGYHLHFLIADRQAGGHILALETDQVNAAIDLTPGFP